MAEADQADRNIRGQLAGLLFRKTQMYSDGGAFQGRLVAGDRVRVLPGEAIRSTLDNWQKYRGCRFVDEMYEYCGGTYTVLKEVRIFYDEVKQKMCRVKDIVILDGVVCSGRQRLYLNGCDRSCFIFWHRAWLERVERN